MRSLEERWRLAQLQHIEQLSQIQALNKDDRIFIDYLHKIHGVDISTSSDMRDAAKNGIEAILRDANEHYRNSQNPLIRTCLRLLQEVADTRLWTISLSMQYIELVEQSSRGEVLFDQPNSLIFGLQAWWQRVQCIYHKLSK